MRPTRVAEVPKSWGPSHAEHRHREEKTESGGRNSAEWLCFLFRNFLSLLVVAFDSPIAIACLQLLTFPLSRRGRFWRFAVYNGAFHFRRPGLRW